MLTVLYIDYEINLWPYKISDSHVLENSLFGAIKLTDADIDKYKYSGYRFDARGFFTFSDGSEIGKNLIILAVDMNSSVHNENKKKIFYLLVKVPHKCHMILHWMQRKNIL